MKEFNLIHPENRSTTPESQSKPSGKSYKSIPALPFEVIVMAGGRGERLKPLTDDLPKPLLPVGNKPIVEYSLNRLVKAGVRNFTFCVNFLGNKIEAYFGDGSNRQVEIDYIYENEPLGTIGGAALKKKFQYEDILIINGDLLTTINFEKFYLYFLEEDADIAVATIQHRVPLPYGILEFSEDNEIRSIKEKPTYTYHINTGIYLVKRRVLDLITEGKSCDAIQLIQAAMANGMKVSSFPLMDYWIDIGQMEDYEKAQKDVGFLDLD